MISIRAIACAAACFAVAVLAAACAPRPFEEGGRALVVGIELYPRLNRSVGDAVDQARHVHAALQKAGVKSKLLLGEAATREAIRDGLEELAADLTPGPRLFVFRGLLQTHDPPQMSDSMAAVHAYAETQRESGSLIYPATLAPAQLIEPFLAQQREGNLVLVLDGGPLDQEINVPAAAGRWRVLATTSGYGQAALPGGTLIRRVAVAPRQADADGDGLTTGLELAAFLTEPGNDAEARTGRTNLAEHEAKDWAGRGLWRMRGVKTGKPEEQDFLATLRRHEYQRACRMRFTSQWPLLASAARQSVHPNLAVAALRGFRRGVQTCLPDDDPVAALENELRAPNPDPIAGMVRVPAGKVRAGCDPQRHTCSGDDAPPRTAQLPAFYMDLTEVTLGDYLLCVEAGACDTPDRAGHFCVAGRTDNHRMAVNCVNWRNAARYCVFAGKRLPTELEWERAARGGDGRGYPWGENFLPDAANCADYAKQDGHRFVAPAGALPAGAGPFGTLDMAGNLNEWVADPASEKWHTDYGGNPLPEPVTARLAKGGGWGASPEQCTTYRRWIAPETAVEGNWGFRCARDAQNP
ncbi:MAG: SUMF1/EgtB/PvdO family nonheme iron enzyme [Candidatus Lernaella stagnicola]|nr:SUMF1/EgtB/PvdO family nonheme iron enzyme [Candidatus Lernaella stagnicola]